MTCPNTVFCREQKAAHIKRRDTIHQRELASESYDEDVYQPPRPPDNFRYLCSCCHSSVSSYLERIFSSKLELFVYRAGASVGIQPTFRSSFPRTPCLSVDGLFDGTGLFVIDCTTPIQTRTFTIDAGGSSTGQGTPGPIKVSGNLCLTVPGGVTTSGTLVQFTSCTSGDPNQQWQWNADGTIVWAGKNKCLDLTDGNLNNYNRVDIPKKIPSRTCVHAISPDPNLDMHYKQPESEMDIEPGQQVRPRAKQKKRTVLIDNSLIAQVSLTQNDGKIDLPVVFVY